MHRIQIDFSICLNNMGIGGENAIKPLVIHWSLVRTQYQNNFRKLLILSYLTLCSIRIIGLKDVVGMVI